ncbi:hypothetical protein ARD30_20985 [Bosea thiooxidans]|uniref:Phospholipase D-like domain-containing protein n=1 Tax=Bosea thiooxidans TaxID=53254 RepID=A0A0Q3PFW3_9HYPH|nr:hypothetical protein [Bosea thiooxidans]KQK28654.1 hypothetical protein ARD30_20985 [Bosea thiooxidans]
MKLYDRFADKEFHTSIAASFGIDFDAYENIVLPRLRGAGCRNNLVLADGRMLTHALCGASALPHHAGRLYTINGIGAPGVFHPKLFLQAGRRRGRLIVSSANLTTPGLGGNLELASMVMSDEPGSGEQQLVAAGWKYLSRFLDGYQQATAAQVDWMLTRAPWLAKATPATGPVGLADGTLAALLTSGEASGIGRRFVELVGGPVERLIIISPYWDRNLAALSYLAERLSPGDIAVLIDPECTVFPKWALGKFQGVRLYNRGDFRKGRFIHAKAIIAQTATADHVLVGSANCTLPALGDADFAGANEEACLYRHLPPGSIADALGLGAILTSERQLDPATLPDLDLDEELPLGELATLNPGSFECRVDTLTWHPTNAFNPAECTITLLDQHGKPMPCRLTPLASRGDTQRFEIGETQERPAFARVQHDDGLVSAPSIVTLIDRLRAVVRETSSRQADNALRQLDDETEASLMLLDVLGILERIEQGDPADKEPISIPKARKDKEDGAPAYRTLNYEQFIAGRRPRMENQLPHNSLAGSNVSIVRSFLNRVIGLGAGDQDGEEQNAPLPAGAFDLGDETGDGQAALNAGEEFDTERTRRAEEEHDRAERRRAAAKKATKEQIVAAVAAFSKRIRDRRESGALDSHDVIRLRALLMIVCTAALPVAVAKDSKVKGSRLQVLPPEGDPNSWPTVIGRALFELFGGKTPGIRNLYLAEQHDQIPDDILECWATCYWCLQACLTAPVSPRERDRLTRYVKPLAELAYVLTLPTKAELLGTDVTNLMSAMSEAYGKRLGIEGDMVTNAHRRMVDALFPTSPRVTV